MVRWLLFVGESNLVVALDAKRAAGNHGLIIGTGRVHQSLEVAEAGSHLCQLRPEGVFHCRSVILVLQHDNQHTIEMLLSTDIRGLSKGWSQGWGGAAAAWDCGGLPALAETEVSAFN